MMTHKCEVPCKVGVLTNRKPSFLKHFTIAVRINTNYYFYIYSCVQLKIDLISIQMITLYTPKMLQYYAFIVKTYNNMLKIHNITKLCDVLNFLSQI